MTNIHEFVREVINTCAFSSFVKEIEILTFDMPVIKLRAYIDKNIFIEVFYNSETGKTSFALIKNGSRVYGVDNTKGWHMHPFKNPEEHEFCNPVSFKEFHNTIEETIKQWA